MNNHSISALIDRAMERINRLDAQLLLAHVLEKPREYVITWPERELSPDTLVKFNTLVEQRANGYPLAYLTGIKSFWDLDLIVNSDVLIPRPETELLVEQALSKLKDHSNILELATGSGAISCALASERPDLQIIATDISEPALKIARLNAEKYGLKNIEFFLSDWFKALASQQFDLIIANPPYLCETDPYLSTDIRFEAKLALVSGQNGDEDYIEIISKARHYLKPQGWILFEHGFDQGPRVRALLEQQGFEKIFTAKDLAGLERVTGGENPILLI